MLESRALHYGKSTGFFCKEAIMRGPEEGFNFFIVYDNLVVAANEGKYGPTPEEHWGVALVSIYPEDGTLPSDHPFCILNAPWVDELERFVAREYIRFLQRPEIQRLAVEHGFDLFNPPPGVEDPPNPYAIGELKLLNLPPPELSIEDFRALWDLCKNPGVA